MINEKLIKDLQGYIKILKKSKDINNIDCENINILEAFIDIFNYSNCSGYNSYHFFKKNVNLIKDFLDKQQKDFLENE